MYTNSEPFKAFSNDLISYGGQLAIVIILWSTRTLTPVNAILALAVTSFLGALIGLWQIRTSIDWRFSPADLRETTATNWSFGKWLLGGNIASLTSDQIYPVLTAGLVSVAATGALRVTKTVLGPTNVLMIALDPLVAPKATRVLAKGGKPALQSFLNKVQILLFVAMGSYCLTVAIFSAPILRYVYGPQYEQYSWLLTVMAILALVSALRAPVKIGLRTLDVTSAIFRTYVASSAVKITIGVIAIYIFGFKGVAIGLIVNSVVVQIMLWRYQARFIGGTRFVPQILVRSHKGRHNTINLDSV